MTTKININDHDALNAAFYCQIVGGEPMPGNTPHYTRSMDAVLPWLEPDLVGISVPKCKGDTWSVHVAPDAAQVEYRAEAPTLPHAAVIALLRANGVTVEGDQQ